MGGSGFTPWTFNRDATHKAVADYLTAKGYIVRDVSSVKSLGFDIIVYAPALRRWAVCEIKSPKKSRAKPGARRYTMTNRKVSEPRLTACELSLRAVAEVAVATTGEEAERQMFGAWL